MIPHFSLAGMLWVLVYHLLYKKTHIVEPACKVLKSSGQDVSSRILIQKKPLYLNHFLISQNKICDNYPESAFRNNETLLIFLFFTGKTRFDRILFHRPVEIVKTCVLKTRVLLFVKKNTYLEGRGNGSLSATLIPFL